MGIELNLEGHAGHHCDSQHRQTAVTNSWNLRSPDNRVFVLTQSLLQMSPPFCSFLSSRRLLLPGEPTKPCGLRDLQSLGTTLLNSEWPSLKGRQRWKTAGLLSSQAWRGKQHCRSQSITHTSSWGPPSASPQARRKRRPFCTPGTEAATSTGSGGGSQAAGSSGSR